MSWRVNTHIFYVSFTGSPFTTIKVGAVSYVKILASRISSGCEHGCLAYLDRFLSACAAAGRTTATPANLQSKGDSATEDQIGRDHATAPDASHVV